MHENTEMAFSDLLSKHCHEKSTIAKIILKPSRGFLDHLSEMDVKLKNIIISLPMKEFDHYRVIRMLRETGATGQFIDNYPLNGTFRLIVYSDRDLSSVQGMEEISGTDHIYETKTAEDILLKGCGCMIHIGATWLHPFVGLTAISVFSCMNPFIIIFPDSMPA